jgi:hypothetical protein
MIAVHSWRQSDHRNSNMAKLTLYHAAPSRSSIARWMLEEVGEPYEIHGTAMW